MSWLVDEAMKLGARPFCLKHWVEAPKQGVKDPNLWGHLQPDPTDPNGVVWCVGPLYNETAEEAEKETAAA